jgi:hypothetical protein
MEGRLHYQHTKKQHS